MTQPTSSDKLFQVFKYLKNRKEDLAISTEELRRKLSFSLNARVLMRAIIQSTITMTASLQMHGFKIKKESNDQIENPEHWVDIEEIEFEDSGQIKAAAISSYFDLNHEEVDVSIKPKTKILYRNQFLMHWEDLQKMSGRYN